jgi:fructosamine-3-kinase
VTRGAQETEAPGPPWVKRDPRAPDGFFAAEARGLEWLRASGTVAVPAVLAVDATSLTLERLDPGPPGTDAAEEFGRRLADLHAAGAAHFGAPWPGFIGPLVQDNTESDDWPSFYADRRVLPYLRDARDRGAVDGPGAAVIERSLGAASGFEGAGERPSRLHGDLWNGNVVWHRGRTGTLIDPAAHGGHRETDLAMLALFGAPHLGRIVDAYDEQRPLAPGWRERLGFHQLHPLLVHAVLFGAPYGERAVAAAHRVPTA